MLVTKLRYKLMHDMLSTLLLTGASSTTCIITLQGDCGTLEDI